VQPPIPKKGLSPLAWIAIGCGGLVLLGGIVAAIAGFFVVGKVREFGREMEADPVATTAKVIAAASPDIELLNADKENQTVTFRNKNTGEEFSFSYRDIQAGRVTFSSDGKSGAIDVATEEGQGRLTVTTDEGRATFGAGAVEIPAWLPVYAGVAPEGTFSSETPEGRAGTFTFQTGDGLEAVLDFYSGELEARGFEMTARTIAPGGGMLNAQAPDDSQSVSIVVSREGGRTQVVVQFSEQNR
jgi:hypothetical protein